MKILNQFVLASSIVLCISAGQVQATPFNGPDSYGYTGSTIDSNLRSMTGSSDIVSGDDQYTAITLPFTFNFYGIDYNQAWVSTNGILGFDMAQAGSYCCNGSPVQNASGVHDYIAPIWMDWVGTVTMKSLGAASTRELILNWSGTEFGGSGSANFQAVLHEGSNDIEFQYGNTINRHHTATIGIANLTGSDGLQYYFGGSVSMINTGLLISSLQPAVSEPITQTVPEPTTLGLLGLGLVGLAAARRRVGRN